MSTKYQPVSQNENEDEDGGDNNRERLIYKCLTKVCKSFLSTTFFYLVIVGISAATTTIISWLGKLDGKLMCQTFDNGCKNDSCSNNFIISILCGFHFICCILTLVLLFICVLFCIHNIYYFIKDWILKMWQEALEETIKEETKEPV
jgi:hypothetical protein